ncbi:MAG: hypothetical protein GY708_17545 [Actinomycetia bacterium]|nr:hypothetical protein [Actinomycetes bacterium]
MSPNMDFSGIVDEIITEAQRRRDSGEYSLDTLEHLDAEFDRFAPLTYRRTGIDGAIRAVESAAFISVEVPTAASRKPFALLKEAIKRATAWYHLHIARQVTTLGIQITRPLRMLHESQQALEARIAELETVSGPTSTMAATIAHKTVPRPTLGEEPTRAMSEAMSSAEGRVLLVGVSEDQAIAVLDSGVNAYVVDPFDDIHRAEVRHESPIAHLRVIADDVLVGVVLANDLVDSSSVVDRMSLLREAVRCIAPGGRLTVLSAEPIRWRSTADAVSSDLLPGTPWAPETWRAVLDHLGSRSETITEVGGALVVVASIA